MESRDPRKSFAQMSHRLRESKNADNSLQTGPVEPIKMLFISNSSGWERVSTENNGRTDQPSKLLRQNYGADEPNAMLKYACRNRAHERLHQVSNDKHAVPGGDLMHREVPGSTCGTRSSRGEAPPPLVGSPDMPMPGIPVAEVRESVMISRLPSGPSSVEKKPSVTNLHGSSPNWTRLSKEASCSRQHGGRSHHRDFTAGTQHDSTIHSVERISSSDLHSTSSVFQTVSRALESQKRNKHNYDSSTGRKYLNFDHRFTEPAATSLYSSAHVSNRQDINRERANTFLNNINNCMFNSLSSIDEMFKDPDIREYSHLNLHAKSSMIRVAQNAQRDLDRSVNKFGELIDVVSSTMTELYNISTSDSYDSCISKVPNRHDYRRYRQVREVTSNLNCYVTTDPSMSPVSVSAFTTTTVTNIGESRRSNHSVGDSFLNDYSKKLNSVTPYIDGRYKFSADESGDRNTKTDVCIENSPTKNHRKQDFPSQEEEKLDNMDKNEENNISKTMNLEPPDKSQENTNEKDKTPASDNFSKELSGNEGTKVNDMNTLENDSAKERSCNINETQEPGKCADITEINKSPDNVSEVLDTNAPAKPENIIQRQGCNKPAIKEDDVENNSGGSGKSTNRRLETRITKLNDHKFYKSVTPVEIAHSIISDYSKSISSSINENPSCQQNISRKFYNREQKQKIVSLENNDVSNNRNNVNPKTNKSSETLDFSDSMPNSPRNLELEFRPCASVTLEEKQKDTTNSVKNCEIQDTEKEAEKKSELNATKIQDVAEQGERGDIKSEKSKKVNVNEETNKCENENLKDCVGTHVLQSLDRKVLDVMELVKNQLEKERTRQSSQLDNTNVRKKNQKNAVVRNESVRFSKDERPASRHTLLNKHLDSRSHKSLHRSRSSRHGDDPEAALKSRRQDHQCEIPNDNKSSDVSTNSNSEKNLRQLAKLGVTSEDSDLSKRMEADQRTALDTLVDNVTGMIKLKKFQLCLIDTLKSNTVESEPQRCKKKVTRPISPANLRLQRKNVLPKSVPELDKEDNSSIGLYPTTARCSLMCQDNRVECISHDIKKRGEETKKALKLKVTGNEWNLKANKIGISNNVTTAAKSDYNKEPKTTIKNQTGEGKCEKCDCKYCDEQISEPNNVKSNEITTVDDMESGSEIITSEESSANVYDIKINIINRTASNINIKEEGVSESLNTEGKPNSSAHESRVNNFASLKEAPQEQLTDREKGGKGDQQQNTEITVKSRSNENCLSKIESNELNDSQLRKENSLQTETVDRIPLQVNDYSREKSAENVKLPVSNNDARLSKSHPVNNHVCHGDKKQFKSNKSLSDSYVKDRNSYLKRNNRITKCTSPIGDVASKAPGNSLKLKEQIRNKSTSPVRPKDSTDKYNKFNSRFTKPCHLERSDVKTKPAQVSDANSQCVQKPSKATTIKATTSSPRNECSHNECDDSKGIEEKTKLFQGYGCGSYVKVDTKLCASEEKAAIETGAISKVHIKTNSSKQLSCRDNPLHQSDHYNEMNTKSKHFLGYGAAVLIKPDGNVTEINLRKNICAKTKCDGSKLHCFNAPGGSLQLEISQSASSSNREPGVNMNENANKATRPTNESFKDINLLSKCSAVKLFLEKPSLEERIIGQVCCCENGLLGGSKCPTRPIDFILNGIKFSDSRKLVTNKSSINKSNFIDDTEGLCFFSPEESNVLIDRNKVIPTIYRRAQSRGFSFFKEMPVFEKRLSTLIEIIESLINDDKHENTCQSGSDNHEETETRETTDDVISTEFGNVDYTKHINEENGIEHTLEYVGNDEEPTMASETSGGCLKCETVPQTGPTRNHLIQLGTDASQTIAVKRKCLVLEENKFYGYNKCDIITNEFSFVAKSKDLPAGDGTISQPQTKSSIGSNIEITHDDLKRQNIMNETISNCVLIHTDVDMPVIKNKSYELETLHVFDGGKSTEFTDNSNNNELNNRSRCSSSSSLFSSCDSLTTNDYVEIFRGYIDGDNSTEREVDLYDDSTGSSIEVKSNFFMEQLDDWKNILGNKQNYHSSEISYNLTVERDTSSNSTAHYPSESEVSTYPRRTSTQSSNISSFKMIHRTENKGINSLERPNIRQEGCKRYSVAEHSQSKQMNFENDAENYWTLNDYIHVREPSTARSSNPVGINMETISEVSSSSLDREIFPSISSIISKCVEDTLNNALTDIAKTIDFETYGHVFKTYDSEHSSCQELTVTETQGCETTDSDSNFNNFSGNVMRTTRISINRCSEDTNGYPSSCTNSHRGMLSTGYNEILNYSSSNSEEGASKGNYTSNVLESSQCAAFQSNTSYSTVQKNMTTWQRGSQKSTDEEDNSQTSSRDQTSLSTENSEMDESSTVGESSESVQGETSVEVLDLTSPETVTRVLDAMAHSVERQPIDDEVEAEVGVFEFHDPSELVFDEDVIHASCDFVLPYPTEDCENSNSEGSLSITQLAEQFSAAVLTRRQTSSAWLEGALRRLESESSSNELSRRRRTREDRGGGALAISICICLFVFVCNRSFIYGDVES